MHQYTSKWRMHGGDRIAGTIGRFVGMETERGIGGDIGLNSRDTYHTSCHVPVTWSHAPRPWPSPTNAMWQRQICSNFALQALRVQVELVELGTLR